VDAGNHLLIEYNPFGAGANACPNLVSFNIDTYAFIADDASNQGGGCVSQTQFCTAGNSKSPALASDSADRVIFAYSGACTFPYVTQGTIQAVSEATLRPIGTYPLPSTAQDSVTGLSWYAPDRELIVESDNGSTRQGVPVVPGVSLTAYKVSDGIEPPTLTAEWTVKVPDCTYSLAPLFASNDPYRSLLQPAIYVACQLSSQQVVSDNAAERDGVVKIELGNKDSSGAGCTDGVDLCPDGNATLAVAPGQGTDFLFDPGSDRGFMPSQSATGITVLIYDGNSSTFIGRTGVGTSAEPNQGGFAIDPDTGRVYVVMPISSMTVIDGRRTPVSVGSRFPQYANYVNYVTLPVLPPDSVYPYPRLLVLPSLGDQSTGNTYSPYFYVYADRLPLTTNPPPPNPDANTFSGPIPAGATVATTYGGNARAFGVHSDFVGSLGGVTSNALQITNVNLPFGSGNRDVMAGAIPELGLQNGSTLGRASALEDANGTTAVGYYQCTDPSTLNQCTGQGLPAGPGGTPPQAWPYPDAACSHPGATGQATATGAYATTGYTSSGQPIQTPVPGTEASYATVQCAAQDHNNGAEASAQFSAMGLGLTNFPSLSIGSGYSTTWASPPSGSTGGATTNAFAVAHGISVSDGRGDSFSMDAVSQTATATANGRAGGASTTDSVQNVTITVNGSSTVLCQQTCSGSLQTVVDQINATFPTLVHISQPQADTTYVHDTTHGNGSPGGYTAVVQRQPLEQYGDMQFNGMTPEEASFLPALRIVLYDDGSNQLSREVVDLAGVQLDAQNGINVLPALDVSNFACTPAAPAPVGPSALAMTGTPAQPATLTISPAAQCGTAAVSAGVLSSTAGTPATAGTPGTPGTPGSAGTPTSGSGGGLGQAIVRFLQGFGLLFCSPLGVIEMLLFLMLLGLPLVLMARRRLWLQDLEEAPV